MAGEQLQFTAAKINVVHTFCDFLAIQIVNTRFHDERVKALVRYTKAELRLIECICTDERLLRQRVESLS